MTCLPEIKKPKILIAVTDNELINRYQHPLRLYGYDVHIAHDGINALRCIYSHLPDIVIIDPNLPQLNGEETCRILKFDSATRHIKILYIEPDTKNNPSTPDTKPKADSLLNKNTDLHTLLSIIQEQTQQLNRSLSPGRNNDKHLSEVDILKRISRILEFKLLEKKCHQPYQQTR